MVERIKDLLNKSWEISCSIWSTSVQIQRYFNILNAEKKVKF